MIRPAPHLVLLLAALPISAQINQTINVTLVEVPVVVSSPSGDSVRGLTKNNFTILDDGKPRQIATFDVVDYGKAEETTTALTPVNPIARRSFLLLFDLANATPNSITRAQQAARQFVQSSLEPRDLAAVATLDVERGYRLLTSFTTDRKLIASAIEAPATFKSRDPFGVANQTEILTAQLDQASKAPVSIVESKGKGLLGAQHEQSMARSMAFVNEDAVRQRVDRQLTALGGLARSLAPVPGRKQVVLLSEGVPARFLTGRDARDSQAALKEAEKIITGAWMTYEGAAMGDLDMDSRFGRASTLTLLQAMEQFFRRSDVVMHAIDLQGIRVQGSTFEGEKVNSNNGLAEMARATGGQMFQNVNDVGENFRRLLKRQEVVYILGFYAPAEKPGAFHNLKVKVNGVSRRAEVDARAGYYEGGRPPAHRALTDAEVMIHDAPEKSIRIASFAASFPSTAEHAQVPVVIEINGEDLNEATLLSAQATLAVYAFDEQGTVRDRLLETLTFDRSVAGDRLRERGVKYYGTLRLPPGNYAVKTLLRVANNGRRGYARCDIHVPQPGEFGVVPFVIDEEPGRWVMVKGTSHDIDGDVYPFQINGQPLMPAVLPRFAAGEARKVALFIVNAQPEQLFVDATPHAEIVESAKTNAITKLILQMAPIGANADAMDVVVRKGETGVLRARLPVIVQ